MAEYATVEQLRAYADLTGGDDADLLIVLRRAQQQLETTPGVFGPWPREADGSIFGDVAGANPKGLTTDQAAALRDVVCAQAEYRLLMGEPFFVRAQRKRSSGPDFSHEGKLPRIGPKVAEELGRAPELRITTARAGG